MAVICALNSSLNNIKFYPYQRISKLPCQRISQSLTIGNVFCDFPQDVYSIYSYFHLLDYGKPIGLVVHGTHMGIMWDVDSEGNVF